MMRVNVQRIRVFYNTFGLNIQRKKLTPGSIFNTGHNSSLHLHTFSERMRTNNIREYKDWQTTHVYVIDREREKTRRRRKREDVKAKEL